MADIRCPMCGKPNPAEADTCQYCQARLTPMLSESGDSSAAQPFSLDSFFAGSVEENNETDWLSSLRNDSTSGSEPAQPEPADAQADTQAASQPEPVKNEEEPEWLQRIHERQSFEQTGPLITEQQGTPEWIKRIKEVPPAENPDYDTQDDMPSPFAQEPAEQSALSPENSPDDEQDWLRNISDWQTRPEDSGALQPAPGFEPDTSGSNPGWMDEPGAPSAGLSDAALPADPSTLPSWLQDSGIPIDPSMPEVSETRPEVNASDEAIPDWLAAAMGKSGASAAESSPVSADAAPTPGVGQLPVQNPAPDAPPASQNASPLDWLSGTQDSMPTTDWSVPAAFLGDDAGQPVDETNPPPSEKSILRHKSFKETEPAREENEAESKTGEPAVQPFPAGTAAPLVQSQPAADAAPAFESEAAPDWLTNAQNDPPLADWSVPAAFLGGDAAQPANEINPPSSEKDFSWLDAFKDPQPLPADNSAGNTALSTPTEPPPTSPAAPVVSSGDQTTVQSQPASTDAAPAFESTPLPEWLITQDNTPAAVWSAPAAFLGEDAGQSVNEIDSPPVETPPQPFSAKDLPDWLGESDFESLDAPVTARPEPEDEPSAMPFKEDSLGWLSTAQPETAEKETAGAVQSDLQPAQLPGWLQAMRPVESIALNTAAVTAVMEEDDSRIEKSGPLAGLRATLPTDSQAVQYHKPPIYSNTLHISDKQNVHATLLESLMSDSGRSHVSTNKARKPSPLPRLIIGVLLVVLVAAFLYLGGGTAAPAASVPSMPRADATLFANNIEALQPNANVILAVDYQPGFDGELRTTCLALLQHLIEKKVNIILVSTIPSGPAIGEDLLLNQPYKEFSAVNLGYLPGGIASLQQFAIDPRSAAPAGYRESANILYYTGLMDKLAIYPVWQTAAMKNIISIKDNAAAIIVATDSIDIGRAWVEQVKPLVGDAPMLFIASAQAAPMLHPYVASRQSAGMLTGLNDGLAYQVYLQQSNAGHPGIPAALNIGAFFAIILVLVGAAIQLLSVLVKQTQRKGKEV